MGLAFRDQPPWFKAVRALNVDLAARLVDVESQVVIAQSKEEVTDQPLEQISASVVRRSEKPYGRRCLNDLAPFHAEQ